MRRGDTEMTRGHETDSVPSATLGEALEELPVLAFMVVLANFAAAAIVAKHTYDFITGGAKER